MARRLSKSLFVLAIALLMISFNPGSVYQSHGPVEPSNYRGKFFAVTTDIHFEITSDDHRNLSVYLMGYEDGYRMLEEVSIENVTWIVAFENINSFKGVLDIPERNWYALIIIAPANETVAYTMTMSRVTPYLDILALGVLLIVLCIVLESKTIIVFLRKYTSI